jgi:hypothetical protein
MPPVAGKLVLQYRSHGVSFATLDGFFLMRCFGEVTPEDLNATLKGHDAAITCRPAGSISLVAVDPTTSFPSEPTRHAAAEVTRKTAEQTSAQATIILGDGFWASAVRGILNTFNSVTPARHPRNVFRHEEEAVEWIINTVGESTVTYRAAVLSGLHQLKTSVVVSAPSPPESSQVP